ncbi:MAG TPA: CARDB domain-containing protein, partial [Dehalococcoidales bacterium]|nr:CARDB domain-containing protein [Dehalococcoidales bacterium]
MPYCPAAFKRVLARSAGLLLALVLGITASGLSYSQSFAADPAPDLTVTDIVLTPADPAIDDAVTVTVTVRNQGSAAAGLSLLAGYADSTLLAAENINNLGAGAVATKSFTWVAQPGTHNIKAVADSSGTIAESDETNNTRTYTLTTLAADLTVQSVTWTPAEPSRGDNIVFSVTVKNQGNAKSRVTNVGFFIDGNSRGYQDIAIIDPGATLTRTYNWVAQAGQHTLRAIVDENNASKESDETNNERTLTFSTLPPDLVVQQIIWSPVNPSKSDNVTFTATVKNQGSGRADSSHLAYYINGEYQSAMAVSAIEAGVSANVTFVWIARADEHDIKAVADYFGKITESDESNNENTVSFLTLAPDLTVKSITWTPANAGVGATVTFTVTVRNMGEGRAEASRAAYYIDGQYLGYLAIPAIAANTETTKTFTWLATTGTHAVAVTADDENLIKETTDENNKLTINVPIIPPDLIIPNIAWSPEKPAIGDIITFTVTVKNQGGGTADNFRVSFYLDDTLLTSAYIDRITAGSAENVTTTWKSENGIHVFKAIADYDKHVTENDEDNNQNSISVMPHMPDLLISNITWSPPGLPSGSEVTFSIVVKNQGSRDSGQSRLAYYVDGTIVGYQDIPSIEAGATVTEKFPWAVAAGNHKIDVVADSVNQVTEVDEENNTRVVNIPPPDLVVRDISWSPPDAAIGETVTFTATVLNQGSGQAPESQVSYYIDGEAAGTWSLPEMNPGGTSSPTFAWTAKAGAHVIRMAADAVNRVTESDETNNEKQTNFGTLTADLVIQSVGWYIDDPRIKDMVTFTVTIENQGSTAAGGSKLSYSINDNP